MHVFVWVGQCGWVWVVGHRERQGSGGSRQLWGFFWRLGLKPNTKNRRKPIAGGADRPPGRGLSDPPYPSPQSLGWCTYTWWFLGLHACMCVLLAWCACVHGGFLVCECLCVWCGWCVCACVCHIRVPKSSKQFGCSILSTGRGRHRLTGQPACQGSSGGCRL